MDPYQQGEVSPLHDVLFVHVSAVLFAADPIGINFGSNTDEYDSETGTILPRLSDCHSAEDVQRVVHEEFVRWFANSAAPHERYLAPATEIWQLWQQFLGQARLA